MKKTIVTCWCWTLLLPSLTNRVDYSGFRGLNPSTSITQDSGQAALTPSSPYPSMPSVCPRSTFSPMSIPRILTPCCRILYPQCPSASTCVYSQTVPCHFIRHTACIFAVSTRKQSHCKSRPSPVCTFQQERVTSCVYLGGGLVNSNEKPWTSEIFHFAGLVVCRIIIFLSLILPTLWTFGCNAAT